jgi:hypothetical protein
MGRAPDHIELMKIIDRDAGPEGGRVFSYYVFRFKNDAPDDWAEKGCLAGISGPSASETRQPPKRGVKRSARSRSGASSSQKSTSRPFKS